MKQTQAAYRFDDVLPVLTYGSTRATATANLVCNLILGQAWNLPRMCDSIVDSSLQSTGQLPLFYENEYLRFMVNISYFDIPQNADRSLYNIVIVDESMCDMNGSGFVSSVLTGSTTGESSFIEYVASFAKSPTISDSVNQIDTITGHVVEAFKCFDRVIGVYRQMYHQELRFIVMLDIVKHDHDLMDELLDVQYDLYQYESEDLFLDFSYIPSPGKKGLIYSSASLVYER